MVWIFFSDFVPRVWTATTFSAAQPKTSLKVKRYICRE